MKKITLILMFASLKMFGQQIDTLFLNYETDVYSLTYEQSKLIENFTADKFAGITYKIYGHTDERGTLNYNELLSKKREREVLKFLLANGIDSSRIEHANYGETKPIRVNSSDKNRALNRRTELIRYKTVLMNTSGKSGGSNPPPSPSPAVESNAPTTIIQPNGIRVTFSKKTFPPKVERSLTRGSNAFGLIENTTQMQENDMLTVTNRRALLSSLMIICPSPFFDSTNCKLDSTVVINVPINNPHNCPLDKIIFLYSQVEEGKKVWKEENQKMYPETIDGKQFISITLSNLCACINFDYKLEEPCYQTDTLTLKFPKSRSHYFEIIIENFNSVYRPLEINPTTISVVIPKGKPEDVSIDTRFKFKTKEYKLKRVPLKKLRYSQHDDTYYLTKKMVKKFRKEWPDLN